MAGEAVFFNVNGALGAGFKGPPDFAEPAALLAEMDRLGVAAAAVYGVAARDCDPLGGNDSLLAALADCPAATGRLAPVLTITPHWRYQPTAWGRFQEQRRRAPGRLLRTFPAELRHQLRHLEPLLERLADERPVLLVEARGGVDEAGLAALAARFAEVSFVLMQCMWGQNLTVMDLLRRHANIYADTSCLHSGGFLEHVVEQFGPERLLFGMGPRAHNGAALGALARAELAAADKALIAGGNLARLAGVDLAAAPQPAPAPGPWARMLDGARLGLDIIDAHGHLGELGLWLTPETTLTAQITVLRRRMDDLGIAATIVSGAPALFAEPVAGNAALAAACGPHAPRLQGYAAFNPCYAEEMTAALAELFAGPFFVGFKILCDYWGTPVTDPRFAPMWRYAHDHRLPVLIHTWEGPYDQPGMLADSAARYPHATLLLGHSGGGDVGRREAEALARQYDNVMLEFCGSFTANRGWEETVAAVGAERVIFGTDAIYHGQPWELARLLSSRLEGETLRAILAGNMRRILSQRV